MAEPATPLPHPRLELSLVEARTRFVQLARLAGLTHQTTVVTEDGRPLAAIVPMGATRPAAFPDADRPNPAAFPDADRPKPAAFPDTGRPKPAAFPDADRSNPAAFPDGDRPNPAAAGWIRRIDKLRAEFRRQHVGLEQALEDAWQELDRLSPPGTDQRVDGLRTAHADLRRRPDPAG
ncbi:hypothetical protein AB0C29_05145 [Actinoplanes sp. NPDC048791]|uniref:hypothetical protein n=1 Tax=Actinoplanes sp. NPDC048791 TaxID=3154623 RepID=UPI0033C4818C